MHQPLDPFAAVTDREAAWYAVHDALENLPGWHVMEAQLHEDEGSGT